MAYYFMVEKRKGEYESLNIEKILNLGNKRKYVKENAFSLQEIDMFTTMFYDLDELRQNLVTSNILPAPMINKPLSIRWVTKNKYSKVPYDFLYQKDLEYLFDIKKTKEKILARFYQRDFVFLKKFAEFFSSHRECATTAAEVRMYCDISIRENICYKHFYDIDQNGDNMIERLIKLLLIEYYEKNNGHIEYKDKINYRNLHTVLAFINHYDEKNKKEINNTSQISLFEDNSKKKVRKKEDEVIQLSFFDDLL